MHIVARYLLGLSLAANQLLNAAAGGRPTETVSFRAALAREHGSKIGRATCAALNALDLHRERPGEDHCAKAARHQRERTRR